MIADYAYDEYKSEKAHHLDEIVFAKFSKETVEEGVVFGEAMKFTRDLANTPAQIATPENLLKLQLVWKVLKLRFLIKTKLQEWA